MKTNREVELFEMYVNNLCRTYGMEDTKTVRPASVSSKTDAALDFLRNLARIYGM